MRIAFAFIAMSALLFVWLRAMSAEQRQKVAAWMRPMLLPAIVSGAIVAAMIVLAINGGITLI